MKCVHIEPLFPKKKQNRLMNTYEQEHERQCAIAFKRPQPTNQRVLRSPRPSL